MASKILEQIAYDIRRLAGNHASYMMSGVVKEVDTGNATCTVLLDTDDDGAPSDGVLLNVATGAVNGIHIIPAMNSRVWVSEVDEPGRWALVRCGTIEKMYVKANTLIEYNGGGLGGLVKVSVLVSKLNALEDLVNDLITKFNVHTHLYVPGPGTATTPSAATTSIETGSIASVTRLDEIENEKIKHG